VREPPVARAHVEHARRGEPVRAEPVGERFDLERGVEQVTRDAPAVEIERDRTERAVLAERVEQAQRAMARHVVGREGVGRLGRAAALIEVLAVAAEITQVDLVLQPQIRPARARRGGMTLVALREREQARVIGAQHVRGAVGQRRARRDPLLCFDERRSI
jgi:hypothetical protein